MNLDGCHALITGASAGIGREFCRQLASRADTIVLVARRRERLEELRDEFTKSHPGLRVHTRAVDLADKNQVDELIGSLNQDKINIDLLINNAGLGDLGAFATSEIERIEQIITVNILALTILTRRLLPPMIAQRKGAILNVSSSAGFLPIAYFATYAASKAYVTSFSEALRMELRGTGVTVSALCPGPVRTEFNEVARRAGNAQPSSPDFVHLSVRDIARIGLTAIERDKPVVVPGLMMKIGMLLTRVTPMPLLRWASRRMRKPA